MTFFWKVIGPERRGPQPVQQNGQLAGYRHDRSLPTILPASRRRSSPHRRNRLSGDKPRMLLRTWTSNRRQYAFPDFEIPNCGALSPDSSLLESKSWAASYPPCGRLFRTEVAPEPLNNSLPPFSWRGLQCPVLERLRKCFLDFGTLILIEVIKNYCFCIIYGASFALREGTSRYFFQTVQYCTAIPHK
jgi:hypothetical protein